MVGARTFGALIRALTVDPSALLSKKRVGRNAGSPNSEQGKISTKPRKPKVRMYCRGVLH